jgi:ribonucleoside-diphosphate reductase subunit M1
MDDNEEQMFVIKRDGSKVPIKFDSITRRNEKISKLLNLNVDCAKLSKKVIASLKNGMKTSEIDELSAEEAYGLSSRNPDYEKLASYIVINNHQKKCPKTFKSCIEKLYMYYDNDKNLTPRGKQINLITKDVYDFTMKHIDIIEKSIDHNKDFKYDYFGFKTLQKSYLLPFNSNITIETPQYMLMGVCIGIWGQHSIDINKIKLVKKVQKHLTKNKIFIHISNKSDNELINMTVNDWNTLIHNYTLLDNNMENATNIYKYIKNLIKPLDGDINKVIERYKCISDHLYTPASPTLFNSRTPYNQLASCFLVSIPDDLTKMYKFLGKIASISSRGGGVGIDLSQIRASGSKISSTQASSSGILPYLRILDNVCLQASQGRRKGSFAVYLQPWHPEIMTFLQIRLPDALPDIRCSNLFTACYNSNLFFERVKSNEKWSLFCPSKWNLVDVYGEEFNKKYLEGEEKKLYNKQIPARDIYEAMCYSRQKSGTPYMLNKDSINEKNMQKNIGTIRCSNLCCEIVEYSDDENIAVCNLTSIALPRFVKQCNYDLSIINELSLQSSIQSRDKNENIDNIIKSFLPQKYFDFKHLGEIVEQCVENCDRIIDINFYPVSDTKRANKNQRPIGIGVQGLSDVYKMMGYAWEDKESFQLNKSIFSVIYYHFLKKSHELAIKYGSYPKFNGSPYSKGILQYHMWNVKPDTSVITQQQWNEIESKVRYGMRNSMGIALMPTASTSQILGNIESIEQTTSNYSTRGTLAGTFYQIDKYLHEELKNRNMWNKQIIEQIIKDRGSVKNLDLPNNIKNIYKTVWEISQKIVIDQAADRSPYVDQTQSLNLHVEKPTLAVLSSMDLYAYSKQLKTMSYYTRSKNSLDANTFTVMEDTVGKLANKKEPYVGGERKEEEKEEEQVCYKGCVSCSA